MSADVITLETVKIERDGETTFIILNRPEKRNAMSPQLHMDMCDALDRHGTWLLLWRRLYACDRM